ncbi:Bug family tripartite tricarboxylate transporter substrate binding protein [Rhizobacter sp. P5_C2]
MTALSSWRIVHILACTLAVAAAPETRSQEWPGGPVRIIVPTTAGSSVDLVARTLGEQLAVRWGRPVIIDNRAGAGGVTGMNAVARSVPDGLTLGLGFSGPVALAALLDGRVPNQAGMELVPVVMATAQPNVLAVSASLPVHDLAEFVTWARQQGGKLAYASVGIGSTSHLGMELFKTVAGFEATHIPYAGSAPAATSLAAGDTQMLFAVQTALKPLVAAGRIRLLATTSLRRSELSPDLPTVAESGYPGFEVMGWNGLFVPAGTPLAIVTKINTDANAALADVTIRAALVSQGMLPAGGSAAAFGQIIAEDIRRWTPVVQRLRLGKD